MINFKQIAMAVGIAVLSSLFIIFLVDAFYQAPEYNDFCTEFAPRPYPEIGKAGCEYKQTPEEEQCYKDRGQPEYDYDENNCAVYRECNLCSREFDEARETYNRNIFYIMAPLGIALMIFGILYSIEFLGSGFMFGGIIVLAYGTIRYFADMNRFVRVIILFVELLLLLWIGIRKVKR